MHQLPRLSTLLDGVDTIEKYSLLTSDCQWLTNQNIIVISSNKISVTSLCLSCPNTFYGLFIGLTRQINTEDLGNIPSMVTGNAFCQFWQLIQPIKSVLINQPDVKVLGLQLILPDVI